MLQTLYIFKHDKIARVLHYEACQPSHLHKRNRFGVFTHSLNVVRVVQVAQLVARLHVIWIVDVVVGSVVARLTRHFTQSRFPPAPPQAHQYDKNHNEENHYSRYNR